MEITQELKDELASKYDIKILEQKIDSVEERLEQKIGSLEEKFNYKLRLNTLFLTIVIILSYLLLNKENLEFFIRILGLVR